MKKNEDIDPQAIDFLPIASLEGKHFIVEDYQRGYKWDSTQIKELLNDIQNHKEGQGKYCLQPIIIRSEEEEEEEGFELIDGQQRLTSIYLLHHYLNNETPYTIDYRTRKGTRHFLKNNLNKLKQTIEQGTAWESFIEEHKEEQFDNVDVYHLFHVYDSIHKWFEEKDFDRIGESFLKKLKSQVSVIWYDIKENTVGQESEKVFLNLNAGKIRLTNSELIKALFVLDIQRTHSEEIGRLKAFEFATDWDQIENRLHDDSFWFFISGHPYYSKTDTRIDLVIDIANQIAPPTKNWADWDNMGAYRMYEGQFFNDQPLNWNLIKQTFNKLREWSEDKEIYHLIGFLINSDIFSLEKILALSKSKNKKQFIVDLNGKIKEEFKRERKDGKKRYDLDIVNYHDFRKESQILLLLLNVQTFLQDLSSNKFPFDLYKKEKWSVEHINPQNPRDFPDVSALIEWLKSFLSSFKIESSNIELQKRIESFIVFLENETNTSKKLATQKIDKEKSIELEAIVESLTELLNLHNIENLALLDRNTNSKIGNMVFIEKRKKILDLFNNAKEENVFIPVNTKDVFTKTYSTDKAIVTDALFGPADMYSYKEFIKKQLQTYFD